MVQFTHLHTHTPEGSLLDGFMRIDKAIDKAKSLGMDSLGVSDHGTMAAHKKFYEACKKKDIHPVLGMEAYITPNKTYKKADFESFDYVTDDNGNYIFSFLTEEEAETSDDTWVLVDSITPAKEKKDLLNRSKEAGGSLYTIVEQTLEGKEMPEAKGQITRMVNGYIKIMAKLNKHLYIQGDSSRRDFFSWFPRIGHLLLIAKNNEGYQNLIHLNNIGQLEGFYGKPRIDFEDIKKYGSGIIATTACLGSIPSQLIMHGRLDEAKAEIKRLVDAFDEVYLEIQPSRQADQHLVNNQLIAWSEELGLPLIATTDAHMVDKDEEALHESITNIGRGGSSDTSEFDEDISVYDSAYLMTVEEILSFDIPEVALQNAYDLAHKCHVDFLETDTIKFPEYEMVEGHSFDTYLRYLAEKGLFDIFMKKDYIKDYQVYQNRLNYELSIIEQKGLSAYFIIVWDYINFAHSKDIYVGAGRGSAAGSLVSYALGITNLDPIKYDLLFERFLNPERNSLPDIDSDYLLVHPGGKPPAYNPVNCWNPLKSICLFDGALRKLATQEPKGRNKKWNNLC